MQRLSCVSDECLLQDHLLSKLIISTWQAHTPGRPEWTCRGFSSVIDKWPFQDHLSSKIIASTGWALSPRRPGQWMCRVESFTVSMMNGLFKTIFQVKLCSKALSPGRPEHQLKVHTRFLQVIDEQPSQDHLLSETMLLIKSSVSGRTQKWTCRTQSSLVLLTNDLFSTILWVKLSYQLIRALSLRWPMHVLRLPLCHQWMAFWRLSSE